MRIEATSNDTTSKFFSEDKSKRKLMSDFLELVLDEVDRSLERRRAIVIVDRARDEYAKNKKKA